MYISEKLMFIYRFEVHLRFIQIKLFNIFVLMLHRYFNIRLNDDYILLQSKEEVL